MSYADYQALLASRDWVGVRYPTEQEFQPNTSYIYIAKASFDEEESEEEEDEEEDNKIANTASRNNAYKIGSTKDIQARSKTLASDLEAKNARILYIWKTLVNKQCEDEIKRFLRNFRRTKGEGETELIFNLDIVTLVHIMQLCILNTLTTEYGKEHPLNSTPQAIKKSDETVQQAFSNELPGNPFDYTEYLPPDPYPEGANKGNFEQYILGTNTGEPAGGLAAGGGNDNGVDFGDDFADLADLADPAANGDTNRYHNGDLLLALLYSAKLRF